MVLRLKNIFYQRRKGLNLQLPAQPLEPGERQIASYCLPAALLLRVSSSALQDGAHTAWALPSTLRVPIIERGRCLPHMKHDMVALPKEVVATKGEPETLDL
jgi:hypothetical protein